MIPPVTINLFQPQAVTRPLKQLIATQETLKHTVEAEEEILFKEVTAEKEVSCKYGKIEATGTTFLTQVCAKDGLVLKNTRAPFATAKSGAVHWKNSAEQRAAAVQIEARNLIDLQHISADQVTSHQGSVKAVHGIFGSILAKDEAILNQGQVTFLRAVNRIQATDLTATKVVCSQGSIHARSSLLQDAYAKTDSILHNCAVLTCVIEKGSLQYTRDEINSVPYQFLQARDSLVLENVQAERADTLGPALAASCQIGVLGAADTIRLIDCRIQTLIVLIDPEKGGELRLEQNCKIDEIIIQKKQPPQTLCKPEVEGAEIKSAALSPKILKIYTENFPLPIRCVDYEGAIQICSFSDLT